MKNNEKNIKGYLFLICIVIVLPVFYSLYSLPESLAKDLELDVAVVKEQTNVTILKLIGFIVAEITIAGIGLFLLIKNSHDYDISELNHYLENYDLTKPKDLNTHQETIATDHQSIKKAILDRISNLPNKLSLKEYCEKTISIIATSLEVSQGAFFITKTLNNTKYLGLIAGYAYYRKDNGEITFAFGEGLPGQVAKAKKIINIKDVPKDYIKIISGLGSATPKNLLLIPIVEKNNTIALIEFASFKSFSEEQEQILSEISPIITQGIINRVK